MRVLRGGSFNNDTRNLRAANGNRNAPDNRNNNIGFRCVRDVERWRASAAAAGAAVVTAAAGVRTPLPDRAPGERRAAFGAEQQKGPGPLVAKSEPRPGPFMR
ncbi:MAG: SUMF1/EgtB/PvdO family nonheme iron enzyme [Bryobacteraceae bacterium]